MKVALVTGSVTGIGLATAQALHADGFRVVLHSTHARKDLPSDADAFISSSPDVEYVAGDFLDPAQPAHVVSAAYAAWGRLDCVVSNAAMPMYSDWLTLSADKWDEVYAVNTRATLLLSQAAAPHLIATQGNIVVVSSTNALRVNKNNLAYDSSKAALNHLAKSLALELRDHKVRVNVVMPGGVNTPMLNDWMVDYAGDKDAAVTALRESQDAGIVAEPADIADVIAFLASDRARWVTGATIIADGGVLLSG
jgi:NAD(P)-dependent dehydrogenase (short-subunit alcohol dehydrogenase family)